jgi:CheY-like chemotaxis protein
MNNYEISTGEMGYLENMHSLFNIFPVGMVIFEKISRNHSTDYDLKFINQTALKIFGKTKIKSKEEINSILRRFNKLKNFSTLNEVYLEMNDESEENLYSTIFNGGELNEVETCERYISKEIMIYVKIKTHQNFKLVSIENFNDERLAIQNNIIKNIKTQYLLTLSHELNNPLNSLTHSVNEVISTKEEKKENKKFLKTMKINISLIKFFIKNFIFSLKMSFDKNTILQLDKKDEDNQVRCLNLEYLFKMIKEKYSIFFDSKKITLDFNFNPIENIYVTYDYEYFKSLIKNIFMYLFYKVDRNLGIKIEFNFEKELKIMFNKIINKKGVNYLDHRTLRKTNQLDTSFVSEINIESSVKTLKILNDIINKFAAMLGIKLKIFEDQSPCFFILYLKYEIEEDLGQLSQDLAEELTYRDSKKKNTSILNRSISILQDTVSQLNKSDLNQSKCLLTTKNENLLSDVSFSMSDNSFISNNLSSFLNKNYSKKQKNSPKQEPLDTATRKNIKKPKISKSYKLNRFMTNVKSFKETVTINSENNSEKEKNVSRNSKHRKVFLRSNFTFKYTNKSSEDEVDLMVDLILDKHGENFVNSKCSSNQFCHSKTEEGNLDLVKNKLKSGSTITINNNINSIHNNFQSTGNKDNISQGSHNLSVKSKTKPSPREMKLNKVTTTTFKDGVKKISPISPLKVNTKKTNEFNNRLTLPSPMNYIQPIQAIQNTQSIQAVQATQSSEKKYTDILVVDDDSFNLNVLKSMLKKIKLKSDTCMNGLECIKKLQSKYSKGIEYKLILMDVMMPVMDGIEASNRIEELIKVNKLNKNMKIIIISAHNDQEIVNRATRLSVVKEFLPKPVKQGDIQRIINNYYI